MPYGEPQLGRRGLYRAVGGDGNPKSQSLAMLWLLTMGDGTSTLFDVAVRSKMPFDELDRAACLLESHELIRWV